MKKLWVSFTLIFFLSFAVLGWIGTRIYQKMPPIPDTIVSTDGTVVVPAATYSAARMSGRLLAAWKSAPFGAMAVT